MLSLIKNLLGGSSTEETSKGADSENRAKDVSPPATDGSNVEEFVEYVVKSLVDHPEDVVLRVVEKPKLSVFEIKCQQKDIGKIIGRRGKTIGAIRALANGAAGRVGKKVAVEVLD